MMDLFVYFNVRVTFHVAAQFDVGRAVLCVTQKSFTKWFLCPDVSLQTEQLQYNGYHTAVLVYQCW